MSPTDGFANSPDRPPVHRRVFAALPVPARIASGLATLAREDTPDHRCHWQHTANYHVTLAFFGDLDDHRLGLLQAALDAHLPLPAPTVSPLTIDCFPNARGQILAAILDRSRQLLALHDIVVATASAIGIACRERRYSPHITLARRVRGAPPFAASRAAIAGLDFAARRFGLYRGVGERDENGGNRYRYVALASFPLTSVPLTNVP